MSGSTCKSCAAPIEWAVTAKNRRRVPLDPGSVKPGTPGALHIVQPAGAHTQRWAYSLTDLAEKIAKAENCSYPRAVEMVETRYPAQTAHFSTCPEAATHRRGRR